MFSKLKNLTIGKRLALGFGLVTVVVLLLGISGYYGAVKSAQNINEIGNNRLPGVESLMTISNSAEKIKASQRTLLNPELGNEDGKRQLDNIATAREAYLAAMKVYEPLPQTDEEAVVWKEFQTALEQWRNDNMEFAKINTERSSLVDTYYGRAKSADASYMRAMAKLNDHANNAMQAFMWQMKEWKNLLLRGNDAAKYDMHFAAFEKGEKMVQEELKNAADMMQQLGLDAKVAEEAMQKHASVCAQYREALKKFDKANAGSSQEVDHAVADIDKVGLESIERTVTVAQESERKFNEVMGRLNKQAMQVCRASETKATGLLEKLVEINTEVAISTTKCAESPVQHPKSGQSNIVVHRRRQSP